MEDSTFGICVLKNDQLGISGQIRFTQTGEITKIAIDLAGLKKGKHGFHIHEFGMNLFIKET